MTKYEKTTSHTEVIHAFQVKDTLVLPEGMGELITRLNRTGQVSFSKAWKVNQDNYGTDAYWRENYPRIVPTITIEGIHGTEHAYVGDWILIPDYEYEEYECSEDSAWISIEREYPFSGWKIVND